MALNCKVSWFQINEDGRAAATSVYVILRVVDNLKTILAPILPCTVQQFWWYVGPDPSGTLDIGS